MHAESFASGKTAGSCLSINWRFVPVADLASTVISIAAQLKGMTIRISCTVPGRLPHGQRENAVVHRNHLDPANRFIEVVCGLIMVLTFTLVGSQLVSDDPSGARKLLIAAVGCNVAWGIIDGVMFVMNGLTERGRRARFVAAVRDATDEAAALSVIGRDLDPQLEGITTSEERGTLYRSIRKIALRAAPQAVRIQKRIFWARLPCFALSS